MLKSERNTQVAVKSDMQQLIHIAPNMPRLWSRQRRPSFTNVLTYEELVLSGPSERAQPT